MSSPATPKAPAPPVRLPCRGCTANCGNYATCDGKPWKATDRNGH